MLTDLNTYLNKAIPDTRLTIKKYLDVKFEYLVSDTGLGKGDPEEEPLPVLVTQVHDEGSCGGPYTSIQITPPGSKNHPRTFLGLAHCPPPSTRATLLHQGAWSPAHQVRGAGGQE